VIDAPNNSSDFNPYSLPIPLAEYPSQPSDISTACLYPDFPGDYTVRLYIADDCRTSHDDIIVTAACNAMPAVVNWQSTVDVMITPTSPQTITLSAELEASTSYLAYNWVMVSWPEASGSVQIMSSTTLKPSFTAWYPGDYVIHFKRNDGCNHVAVETVTVTVTCDTTETACLQEWTEYDWKLIDFKPTHTYTEASNANSGGSSSDVVGTLNQVQTGLTFGLAVPFGVAIVVVALLVLWRRRKSSGGN